jgi:L,D-transpeptidase catalytic domain/Putative peptidoglycan binding domain
MGKRTLLIASLGAAALVLGAVAAYAWDSSRDDLIAQGVRVGGVDVGGMRASAARVALDKELVTPLSRPVTVTFEGRRWRLPSQRVGLHADVDGMIEAALDASREGGIFARLWRSVTGGEVDSQQPPLVAYSDRRLRDFVRDVAVAVGRKPRSASVQATASSLQPVQERDGRRLESAELRAAIRRELDVPAGDRVVEARARTLKPAVTGDELAEQYPWYITVDRSGFTLRLFKRLALFKTYRVAIGAAGYETPTGLYNIQSKQIDPVWHVPKKKWAGKLAGRVIPPGPDNPLKARWMGIYNGAGIHGTESINSLGRAASHGCVRMAIPDVIDLYDKVPAGTPVFIA